MLRSFCSNIGFWVQPCDGLLNCALVEHKDMKHTDYSTDHVICRWQQHYHDCDLTESPVTILVLLSTSHLQSFLAPCMADNNHRESASQRALGSKQLLSLMILKPLIPALWLADSAKLND